MTNILKILRLLRIEAGASWAQRHGDWYSFETTEDGGKIKQE